ncbi:thioredoxin family protein [[Eubacterium] cellulosolvens]
MAMKIGQDIFDYINTVRNQNSKQTMKRRVQEYQPKQDIVDRFAALNSRYYMVVFSAEWNAECRVHIPSLAKLMIQANNSIVSVKVVHFDENRDIAEEMRVLRIPTIVVHDRSWREIGRFVEKAQHGGTLEEELWEIVKKSANVT